MIYKKFSKLLKEKRENLGYTQNKMATILSISASKYNKIENGSAEPSFYELYLLCTILNIDLNSFFKSFKPNHFMNFD